MLTTGAVFASFRIARRIDQRHARRAGLAGHRIARRGLAVERQAQDLAELLVGILGGRHALAIADRQEQVLAVGREGDLRAELSAPALGHLAPQHLQPVEARRAVADAPVGPARAPGSTRRRPAPTYVR